MDPARLVDDIERALASSPPAGIPAEYIRAFFRRHRTRVIALVRGLLGEAGRLAPVPASERPLVIACSATKEPGRLPARDKYLGPLWSTYRKHGGNFAPGRVWVLSAKYGLIGARTVIDDYDMELAAQPSGPNQVTPAQLATEIREVVEGQGLTEVDFAGGALYAEALRLAGVTVHRLDARGIGYQRQALAAHLTGDPSLAPDDNGPGEEDGARTGVVLSIERHKGTSGTRVDVWARDGEETAGRLVLSRTEREHIDTRYCDVSELLREIMRWRPRARVDFYEVESLSVWPKWNGKGVGLSLYDYALQQLPSFFGGPDVVAVLVQGKCGDGSTSPDAERVWARLVKVWTAAADGRSAASLPKTAPVSEVDEYIAEGTENLDPDELRASAGARHFGRPGASMRDASPAVRWSGNIGIAAGDPQVADGDAFVYAIRQGPEIRPTFYVVHEKRTKVYNRRASSRFLDAQGRVQSTPVGFADEGAARDAAELHARGRQVDAGEAPADGEDDEEPSRLQDRPASEEYTAALAKLFGRLKRSLALSSSRQNYKGTGSQAARRQLLLRFRNGATIDVWLNHDGVVFGGVTATLPAGAARRQAPPFIRYAGRMHEAVFADIEAALAKWMGVEPVELT